ncbi:DUF5305 family protein [Sporosarcina sp. FA9]|uniref:DUF5305 family protein n=1 Tax=Sporosarcina sp. FA9 TaxID=3413030 RepID=UPI003F657667
MSRFLDSLFKGNTKKRIVILAPLLLIFAAIAVYSMFTPLLTSNETVVNSVQIGTSYEYKAVITPNILYPNGGTVDAGDTIFKKITTAIPLDIKSTIVADQEVVAKGTYEVELLIKANDLWERSFPLDEKRSFDLKGTELSIIDGTFTIDLNKMNRFITQVEEETGIKPSQYVFEVTPNIIGEIQFGGQEKNIDLGDKLIFDYMYDELVLSSEKAFTSVNTFSSVETISNAFFGLPIEQTRIVSTIISILLLLFILITIKNVTPIRNKSTALQSDKINKKYSNRIIQVSQKVSDAQKTIISMYSFKSILKIADEKELPIFCHKMYGDGNAVYFIVDGDYVYDYETVKSTVTTSTEKVSGSEKAYADG